MPRSRAETDDTCGVDNGGAGFCWGHNFDGQLGIGTYDTALVPTAVAGGLTFSVISSGFEHSCGLVSGTPYCWGSDFAGQTGDTLGPNRDSLPDSLPGGWKFTSIAAGGAHTCALSNVAVAYCWGDNTFGQLGTVTTGTPFPHLVSGGHAFIAIAAHAGTTCALSGTQAYCWGHNNTGAIGDGSKTDRIGPAAVVQ